MRGIYIKEYVQCEDLVSTCTFVKWFFLINTDRINITQPYISYHQINYQKIKLMKIHWIYFKINKAVWQIINEL